MRREGATVVDVRFPKWLLEAKGEFYNAIRYPEFAAQIAEYLATIGPSYPKNIDQLIERATRSERLARGRRRSEPRPMGSDEARSWQRNAGRLPLHLGARSCPADGAGRCRRHPRIAEARRHRLSDRTAPARADRRAARSSRRRSGSAANLANLTGFPDLIVPAGFTGDDLPVGLSFFGPAFSEPKLLALGYSFEQATRARRLPVHTPRLQDETITVP